MIAPQHTEKPGHCAACAEALADLRALIERVDRENAARCLALADTLARKQAREAAPVGVCRPLLDVRVAPPSADCGLDWMIGTLRDYHGTAAILAALERLERADVLAASDDLMCAADHQDVAVALRVARETAADVETRLREPPRVEATHA